MPAGFTPGGLFIYGTGDPYFYCLFSINRPPPKWRRLPAYAGLMQRVVINDLLLLMIC